MSLGPATDLALDNSLEPTTYAEASSAFVTFGDGTSHSWKVFVGAADPKMEEPDACQPSGSLLVCSIASTSDGGYAAETVIASKSVPELGDGFYRQLTDDEQVDPDHLSDYRYEHNVRVVHADGSMTSVTETVIGPPSVDPEKAFASPVDDLSALATDARLVWD